MRILMIGSEATPFVKTGGLADVLGALPAALVRGGDEVAVLLPRYRVTETGDAQRIASNIPLRAGPHLFRGAIDQVIHDGVRYLFLDCPPLYDRAGIYYEGGYDYPDNHIRFAILCQAALAIGRGILRAEIYHAHDWQASLVPLFLRTAYAMDPTFFGAKSVLTIHNLGYQGNFGSGAVADLGLDAAEFTPSGYEFYGQVSFLKAGIVFADAITTVSPTYATEIQTPEYGFGFDGLLRGQTHKLTGILNGADYGEWNPETDPYIRQRYSARNLSGKTASKLALLEELGLPLDLARPLIGIVSRFVDQKGFDLVAGIAAELVEENVALAVLGSGERRFEEMFRSLAMSHPEQFGVRIGYDHALAHRIEAGSDMFLMPSRYEPCGLSQIYSLRYGTVPIVRSTGGLEDTVEPKTGFKFSGYSGEALLEAIRAAEQAWQDLDAWQARMRRGMEKDFSWDASAAKYQQVYRMLRGGTQLASEGPFQASLVTERKG